MRFVKYFIANAVDRHKQNAGKNGGSNVLLFKVNYLVLLSTVNLPRHTVDHVSSKLLQRFISEFHVLHHQDNAYTIELLCWMRKHPAYYVGCFRPFYQYKTSP